jgi:hypothetical protein
MKLTGLFSDLLFLKNVLMSIASHFHIFERKNGWKRNFKVGKSMMFKKNSEGKNVQFNL